MLTRKEKAWCWFAFLFITFFIVMGLHALNKKYYNVYAEKKKTQTDVEVKAMVGIFAENKLGGIQFAVSDRWGYHRVTFQVWGFDEGLNLDNVVCHRYHGGKYIKEGFVRWKPGRDSWDTWLGRYQEVLAEATIGEKNFLDPNIIFVH